MRDSIEQGWLQLCMASNKKAEMEDFEESTYPKMKDAMAEIERRATIVTNKILANERDHPHNRKASVLEQAETVCFGSLESSTSCIKEFEDSQLGSADI